jgi:hypothetical protein
MERSLGLQGLQDRQICFARPILRHTLSPANRQIPCCTDEKVVHHRGLANVDDGAGGTITVFYMSRESNELL